MLHCAILLLIFMGGVQWVAFMGAQWGGVQRVAFMGVQWGRSVGGIHGCSVGGIHGCSVGC